jgi:exosome complex component RRP46
MAISLVLHPLRRADGSATYTHAASKTTILCGVNFPTEAPARSSLPEECCVEVNVRAHNGVGQVKERHLEWLVADALRSVVLLETYPRMMLQVTLQLVSQARDEQAVSGGGGGQGESYLPALAGLVNAAVAGCLDAGVSMRCSVVATTVAVMAGSGELKVDPGVKDLQKTTSLHVFGFSAVGELVLVESEGVFTFDEWERLEARARTVCLGSGGGSGHMTMVVDSDLDGADKSLLDIVRGSIEARVMADERWRGGGAVHPRGASTGKA